MTNNITGPLKGIRVIDLTAMISGPMATAILADQGAEVIKVEPPSGDQLRYMGPPHNGVAACFFACNRNKKSVRLDLKQDSGKDSLRALLKDADILVQNFRPGAMARMGFSEEDVRKINPNIIYVSISGFGEQGPYSNQRVYDPIVQALSGMTDIQADKTTRQPKMVQFVIADKVTALTTAQAISTALFHRERHGVAQHVRISMLNAMVGFHWPEAMVGLTFKEFEFDVTQLPASMDQIFKTKDEQYVTCSAISDSEWSAVCKALNKPEWIDDERFNTIAARGKNSNERKRLTGEEVAKYDRDWLLKRFAEEQAPAAPLLSRMELIDNEQVAINGDIQIYEFDGFGEVRQASPAADFDKSPSQIHSPAPQLGEHTDEILAGIGG